MTTQNDELDTHVMALGLASSFYQTQRAESVEAQDYLKTRDFPEGLLRRFGVGFAPDRWDGLSGHYSTRRMAETAVSAGLLRDRQSGKGRYDFFRGRIMIPVHNTDGKVVGFGGRSMPGMSSDEEKDGVKPPKYMNSPESEFYHKSELLYGAYQAKESIQRTGKAIVVEGYFDVMRLHQNRFSMAVGSCGTALTKEHVKLLRDLGARELYFCFDGDRAGTRASLAAAGVALQGMAPWMKLYFVEMDGQDPDDMLREHGPAAFQQKLKTANSLLQFLDKHLWTEEAQSSLEGKAKYAGDMQQYGMAATGPHRNAIMRHVASRLGYDNVFHVGKTAVPYEAQVTIPDSEVLLGRLLLHGQVSKEALDQSVANNPEFAQNIVDPHSDIHFLCRQLGPVPPGELQAQMAQAADEELKRALGSALDLVRDMPFDNGLKDNVKRMMVLG